MQAKYLEQFSLNGKVAIITGATGGLARELVLILLDAGAKVVLADINQQALNTFFKELKTPTNVLTQICDVTCKADIEKVISNTHEKFGQIDILVNCAGILGSDLLTFDILESEWDDVINVNLKGTWLMSTEVARYMIKHETQGKIVNISSTLGYFSYLKRVHYATSKAGVEHLTRNMALELLPHGIHVNCLAPGWVNTPMVKQFLEGDIGIKYRNVMPMKRAAEPKELVGTLLLLTSKASSYMTGVTLRVDGGYSCTSLVSPEIGS